MAENQPIFSGEVAALAWETAHRTNAAFDAVAEVDARIAGLENAEHAVAELGLPGVELVCVEEARGSLDIERKKREITFTQLYDMAAVVMGGQTIIGNPETSPWSMNHTNEAITEVKVPEVDADTQEKLEAVSPEFAKLVVARYEQKYVAVEGYIKDGRLPESYRMPELGALVELAVAVAPTLEHLKTMDGTAAELEFAPQGLSREQWDSLLKGHTLNNCKQTEGNWYSFTERIADPLDAPNVGILWDVVVIAESMRPTFTNVSKDGAHGSNAKKALKAIKDMPGVTQETQAGLIAEVSPSEATYNAAQLSLLERSQVPMDTETWTISRENVTVDGQVRSVFQHFVPAYRRVYSSWGYLDVAYDSGGVRPSASGSDLVFKAATSV